MRETIQVGNRLIGKNQPAFIVAEIGSNHNQDLDQAKQLIEAAAEAGADGVKFQLFAAEDLYPPETSTYEALKAVELPKDWLPELANYSTKCKVIFFASPFSREAVDSLESIDVSVYKWASSETTNLPLLRYAADRQKPILLSTGMCDLADVYEAVETARSADNIEMVLLQCTSLYPAEPGHVHLRAMDTLRAAFQLPVGLSDHTMDVVIPAAAVARGACVIEKHLTLDRQLAGPDHGYALEPAEFKRMVDGIRATEEALGASEKTILREEMELARRSSIRAARDIETGQELTEDLLIIERPAGGIRPRFLRVVLGRRALAPIQQGEAITWEKI
jgi:N-acetylneuraminate synthase/N,N'-diacetyllegionaminate synthase